MAHSAVVVFTGRSLGRLLREGGSQAWALNASRARRTKYLVCTQNQYAGDWADPDKPHGTGFVVGKIDCVVPSSENSERYLIQCSEYAEIDIPNLWDGGRNPVRYSTLEDLGINPSELKFRECPEPDSDYVVRGTREKASNEIMPLNISDAKEALAAFYDISPEKIEIVIRG